ncbi:MAG: EamA family transporter RarD [Syntrophobacteraceae bacterium]
MKTKIGNTAVPSLRGFFCALSALLIWGLSPIYWKELSGVSSFEIVLHRVVWSCLFLFPLVLRQDPWKEFSSALRNRRILMILLCTTILISTNWLIFIWAIANDFVLQTSLGYYINPLLNVLLGVVFLGERLRRAQAFAAILACAGVVYLTISMGEFPWVALSLACTFALYSLIRKVAPVGALAGLTLEIVLLSLPSAAWLLYLHLTGSGAFLHMGTSIDLLLMASALATGFPLLLFTIGARQMRLSTLGFMQYILPSGYFLCAVFIFNEPFSGAQLTSFFIIWVALAIYSTDSALLHKKALRFGH